jgi:hypothetical protein
MPNDGLSNAISCGEKRFLWCFEHGLVFSVNVHVNLSRVFRKQTVVPTLAGVPLKTDLTPSGGNGHPLLRCVFGSIKILQRV